jgi:hypothetical protein
MIDAERAPANIFDNRDRGRLALVEFLLLTLWEEPGVIAQSEQPRVIDRGVPDAEQGARRALRGQIARMERELSEIVAGMFPHISPIADGSRGMLAPGVTYRAEQMRSGPSLLTLAELEQMRDSLAGRVQDLRRMAVGAHEARTWPLQVRPLARKRSR